MEDKHTKDYRNLFPVQRGKSLLIATLTIYIRIVMEWFAMLTPNQPHREPPPSQDGAMANENAQMCCEIIVLWVMGRDGVRVKMQHAAVCEIAFD